MFSKKVCLQIVNHCWLHTLFAGVPGFYLREFQKILAHTYKWYVCVLNKYALCFYMILFKGPG